MKHYPEEFWEQGSHGHGHRLLADAGLPEGVVLDLGCASGPLAEPVQELGHNYVGLDIDPSALEDLAARGFEAHQIDLQVLESDRLEALAEIVGDRPLRAVLLLDVLEHLADPSATLRALGRLSESHEGMQIVVSIPNVSHVDVGIKLLMGRWDLTEIGLLDDTHIRFFNHGLVARTMAKTGWVEVAAADVVNPFSDQLFPADAPALRPGTPLRQLLWRVRMAADPYGETYQFVRRYRYDPETAATQAGAFDVQDQTAEQAAAEPFLSVVVRVPDSSAGGGSGQPRLIADLASQADGDIEVLISHETNDQGSSLPDGLAMGARRVVTPPGKDWRDAAVAEARGRYVALLDHRTRLSSNYLATLRQMSEALPSRVVQLGACSAPMADLSDDVSIDSLVDRLERVSLDPLDLVTSAPFGSVALDAHVIPRQAWAANGLTITAGAGDAASTLLLLGAIEWCGIVRSNDPVAVVHPAAVRDVSRDLDSLEKHVGLQPMVIPEGAGSQLFAHRQELATAIPQRDALAQELAAVRDQAETLSLHLRERDSQLAQANAFLARIERLPWMRIRRKLGAIKRRLLGQ